MNDVVKNVFLLIMGVTVAALLYIFFFGNTNLRGDNLYMGNANLHWKGALWYAAEQMESPISRYYYEYCYLPNVHANTYVDDALGGDRSGRFQKTYDIQTTYTDLSKDIDVSYFGSSCDYSTGWN